MRRLPWTAVVRADRRGILTSIAVALGVSFAVVGFAVPAGLESESIQEEGPFAHPDTLLTASDGGTIATDAAGPGALAVLVTRATLREGTPVVLVAIEGNDTYGVPPGEARPGFAPWGTLQANLTGRVLTMGDPIVDARVPRGWLLVDASLVRELDPALSPGRASYLIVPRVAATGPVGTGSDRVPGVEPFFRASALEVVGDLFLVVAFSSVLVGLLVYEFLRAEIRERRREIGIWRSVGMQRPDVLSLLMGRAAFVTGLGSLGGVVLATLALDAAGRATASGVLADGLSPLVSTGLGLTFFAAGMLGAIVPAASATRQDVARVLEERS